MKTLNYDLRIKTADNKIISFVSNQNTGEALTLQFNIVRTIDSQANYMDLQIYNLSLNTRNQITKDKFNIKEYIGVQFRAGRNTLLKMIFQGNVNRSWSVRNGAEIITHFNCVDGGLAVYRAHSNQSFSAGTSRTDVVKALFKDLKDYEITELSLLGVDKLPPLEKGYTYTGNTVSLIRDVVGTTNQYTNCMVFIDLGKLQIIPETNVGIPSEIPNINSSTGLLSVPTREGGYISVNIMFNPDIVVGDFIQIESSVDKQFDGQYKVNGITHSGTISGSGESNCTTTLQLFVGDANLRKFQSS